MDEVINAQENESGVILTECREALRDKGISLDRLEQTAGLLEKALEEENLLETLVDDVMVQHDIYKEKITEEVLLGMTRGLTFEAIGLVCLPKKERQFKELERFLLWSIKDPRMWVMEWEDTDLLTKDEKKQLETYKRVRPDADELQALRHNDAISIRIETDPASNKRVAVITGIVEAKNHAVRGNTRDGRQMEQAPEVLNNTVRRFRNSYPLIIKGLGLTDAGFPDAIDIVDTSELTYEILHPQDIEEKYRHSGIPPEFKDCTFSYVPITTSEIRILSQVLAEHVKKRLPDGVFQEEISSVR